MVLFGLIGILTIVVASDKVTGKVTILARKNSQSSFVASDKITGKKSLKSYSFGLDKFIWQITIVLIV